MLKKQYLNNFKQLLIPFLIVVILGTILITYSSFSMGYNSIINAPIEACIYGCEPIDLFFPLLASLPFSWVIFAEKRNGFMNYVAIRTNKKAYIRDKMISAMALSFLAIFIIYFLSLIIVLAFNKFDIVSGKSGLNDYMFGQMQLHYPILFGIMWAAWKGCISALICQIGRAHV